MEVAGQVVYHGGVVPQDAMTNVEGYRILPVTIRDSHRVLNFLKKFFFRDEPLNLCIGLLDEQPTCHELERYCLQPISDGYCLMAVSPKDQILGVCINGPIVRGEVEEEVECNNKKFRKIVELLERVSREGDILGRFPSVQTILEVKVVSVDETVRGRGIAKALINATKWLAREKDIPLLKVDCSSHFTGLAVEKLGFTCIYQLKYEDHRDAAGTPVFSPEPPHTSVKTYVYQIN